MPRIQPGFDLQGVPALDGLPPISPEMEGHMNEPVKVQLQALTIYTSSLWSHSIIGFRSHVTYRLHTKNSTLPKMKLLSLARGSNVLQAGREFDECPGDDMREDSKPSTPLLSGAHPPVTARSIRGAPSPAERQCMLQAAHSMDVPGSRVAAACLDRMLQSLCCRYIWTVGDERLHVQESMQSADLIMVGLSCVVAMNTHVMQATMANLRRSASWLACPSRLVVHRYHHPFSSSSRNAAAFCQGLQLLPYVDTAAGT